MSEDQNSDETPKERQNSNEDDHDKDNSADLAQDVKEESRPALKKEEPEAPSVLHEDELGSQVNNFKAKEDKHHMVTGDGIEEELAQENEEKSFDDEQKGTENIVNKKFELTANEQIGEEKLNDPQIAPTNENIEADHVGESTKISPEVKNDIKEELISRPPVDKSDEKDDFNLQELAKEYEDKEHKPRGTLLSIIVTLSFIAGPIFLAIVSLSPNAFAWSPIDMKIISSSILVLFLIIVIYSAWKRAQ